MKKLAVIALGGNAIIRSDVVRPELKEKAVNELNRLQFEEAMRAIAA